MCFGRDYVLRVYDSLKLKLGKVSVFRKGSDVFFVVVGVMVLVVFEMVRKFEERGISVGVVDMYMIKFFDEEMLLRLVVKVDLVVIFEEYSIYGGFGGVVVEVFFGKDVEEVY